MPATPGEWWRRRTPQVAAARMRPRPQRGPGGAHTSSALRPGLQVSGAPTGRPAGRGLERGRPQLSRTECVCITCLTGVAGVTELRSRFLMLGEDAYCAFGMGSTGGGNCSAERELLMLALPIFWNFEGIFYLIWMFIILYIIYTKPLGWIRINN